MFLNNYAREIFTSVTVVKAQMLWFYVFRLPELFFTFV